MLHGSLSFFCSVCIERLTHVEGSKDINGTSITYPLYFHSIRRPALLILIMPTFLTPLCFNFQFSFYFALKNCTAFSMTVSWVPISLIRLSMKLLVVFVHVKAIHSCSITHDCHMPQVKTPISKNKVCSFISHNLPLLIYYYAYDYGRYIKAFHFSVLRCIWLKRHSCNHIFYFIFKVFFESQEDYRSVV